ncbi:uncharacterized protein LOC132729777 [Ruditapes philippinarum]|uniref:uncharacterized protein LOC132729777 n=1 Tax=Ruditapes philippinarum TaxID=129788 RepID=UPI00295A9B82|nr:uncharacterized protein LOC132729777 [Ruditapes philippinarum]
MFYSKSESFNTFCHELEGLEGFSLLIGPTFEKIDFKSQDVTEMNQNEALIEILQIPYTLEGIQLLKPILVVAKDTTASANYIVSYWLNNVDNNNYPMNLNSLDGVFLLKIADSDDVTDLDIMMAERFEMKKSDYSQRILIIFECIPTDHFKLKKIYNLACSCKFQACKFIIITKIETQVVLGLQLDMQFILIADKIDALHVARAQFDERIDGHKLSKIIDQIVSKRKCVLWQKDAITKICFENIHPLNEAATIRVPKDINNIEFHGCSHKIQVLHCANHLDISVSNRFSNILPENIVTPTLTTIAIYFKSLGHVFRKSVYESFAFNISKATQILSLRLCNMTFGRKSITVELQKEGIEQIRQSIESNEDYCRFGARILGPCLGKISFDKEDVESKNNNSFVKQIMLDLICYELVKTHQSVSECYASERECGTIKLICFVNDDVQIDSFKGFPLLKTDYNNISKESLFAENSCDREDNTVVNATVEEFEDINETLSFHAEALMASHRNLEAVKVSFVQPKDMTLVQSKLCIVLYCRAKGYIPYGDVRFPRTLIHPFKNKSFRTDVREGYFIACPYRTDHSTDFNKELAIGCTDNMSKNLLLL